jgi:hypothetical protein
MSFKLQKDNIRMVSQWCSLVKELISLTVMGSVYGNMINGKVLECSKNGCKFYNAKGCWKEKHIQMALS